MAPHAVALARLERRVYQALALGGATLLGFRVALAAYGGSSVGTGLSLVAGVSALVWLAWMFLPQSTRTVLRYLLALLLW